MFVSRSELPESAQAKLPTPAPAWPVGLLGGTLGEGTKLSVKFLADHAKTDLTTARNYLLWLIQSGAVTALDKGQYKLRDKGIAPVLAQISNHLVYVHPSRDEQEALVTGRLPNGEEDFSAVSMIEAILQGVEESPIATRTRADLLDLVSTSDLEVDAAHAFVRFIKEHGWEPDLIARAETRLASAEQELARVKSDAAAALAKRG